MIKIVNLRNITSRSGIEVVGRPSILGNPYHIGRDGNREKVIRLYSAWLAAGLRRSVPDHIGRDGNREKVIRLYRAWLATGLKRSVPVHKELHRLAKIARNNDLVLGCWCAPKACHADVIKSAIQWINKTFYNF